jgi:electron transfer flavoprotein alpha/beta subunit
LLKLLACFKTTWNLDDVTAEEWDFLEKGRTPSFMKKTLSAYDESALELALRLADGAKQTLGRETELTAVTVDADENIEDHVTKNLFAIGYTRVAHVACAEDLRFRPDLTAGMLCGFIGQEESGFDLILTGQQANVGDNGQTHLLMAEKLGLPCVLNVIDASYLPNPQEGQGWVRVVSLADDGILEQTLTKPAILGVANAAHPYLRVPTLRERMAASQKSVLAVSGENLVPLDGRQPPRVVHTGLALKKLRRECRFIQGGSPEEKARLLYDSCLEEVLRS